VKPSGFGSDNERAFRARCGYRDGRPNTMNQSYVQTFNRHRLLFSLPVVIMTVFALWFVAGTPKQYKAGATLLVDNPVNQPSSFNNPNPAAPTPADQTQQLLSELLATRSFRLEVGRKGPLTKYLAAHPGEGWGPTALLSKLRGARSPQDMTWDALDAKHIIAAPSGSQVVSIELHGPTPEVAVGTLQTLLRTFARERQAIAVKRQEGAVELYKSQLETAQRQLGDINTKIASGEILPADAPARLRAAEARVRRSTRALGDARFSLESPKGIGPTYHVVDKPSLPAPAVSGMKKSLFGVVAGIFVGCLISLLAIVLLTGNDEKQREREELREVIARADDDAPLDVEHANGTNGSAVPEVPRVKAKGER
jgi:hypothetical protein